MERSVPGYHIASPRARLGWRWLLGWVGLAFLSFWLYATLESFILGKAIGVLYLVAPHLVTVNAPMDPTQLAPLLLDLAINCVLLGGMTGLLQGWWLRHLLRHWWVWIGVSIIGWLAAGAIQVVGSVDVPPGSRFWLLWDDQPVVALVMGGVAGLGQAIMLGCYTRWAWLWPVATGVALVIYQSLRHEIAYGTNSWFRDSSLGPTIIRLAWAGPSIISGLTLWWLLRSRAVDDAGYLVRPFRRATFPSAASAPRASADEGRRL